MRPGRLCRLCRLCPPGRPGQGRCVVDGAFCTIADGAGWCKVRHQARGDAPN